MYWDICAEYLLVTLRQSGAFPQFRDNGSIASVKASRAINDNSLQLMQVFLLVSYADSTQEEIVVPMVEREGEWKMK